MDDFVIKKTNYKSIMKKNLNTYCIPLLNHNNHIASYPKIRAGNFQPLYLTTKLKSLYVWGEPEIDKIAFVNTLCEGLNLESQIITSFTELHKATLLDHPDRLLILDIKPQNFKNRECDFERILKVYDQRTITTPYSYRTLPEGLKRVYVSDFSPQDFMKKYPKLLSERSFNLLLVSIEVKK